MESLCSRRRAILTQVELDQRRAGSWRVRAWTAVFCRGMGCSQAEKLVPHCCRLGLVLRTLQPSYPYQHIRLAKHEAGQPIAAVLVRFRDLEFVVDCHPCWCVNSLSPFVCTRCHVPLNATGKRMCCSATLLFGQDSLGERPDANG